MTIETEKSPRERELKALLEVVEKRIETERRNGPETTMEYSEYLNAADAFREKFTPASCAALMREALRLQRENELIVTSIAARQIVRELADLPLLVSGSQKAVFQSLRQLQERARSSVKGQNCPDEHVTVLYRAVQDYVDKNGGKVMVIGGVRIEEWPQDNTGVFHIAIRCTGKKPDFPQR